MTLKELLVYIPYCEDIDLCTYDYQQIILGNKRSIKDTLKQFEQEEIYGIESNDSCLLVTLAKDYKELFTD